MTCCSETIFSVVERLRHAPIEAALKRAGNVVTPKFDQQDAIKKQLNDLFESGYTGAFRSKGLADYLGARMSRPASGRRDRDARASRSWEGLAAIDLAERLFGPETAERIRSGRLEIDAIAEALDRKREDIITQEQVQQAEEFRERLSEAYEQIDNALHVSVSLAGAGQAVLDVWLKIVEATAQASTVAGGFLDKMLAAAKAARDVQPTSALQSPLAPRQAGEVGEPLARTSALPPAAPLAGAPCIPRRSARTSRP